MPVIDFNSLQDPDPEQMYKLTKHTIAQVMAFGVAKGSDGQSITKASLPDLERQLKYWSAIINASDETNGGGTALVEFSDP